MSREAQRYAREIDEALLDYDESRYDGCDDYGDDTDTDWDYDAWYDSFLVACDRRERDDEPRFMFYDDSLDDVEPEQSYEDAVGGIDEDFEQHGHEPWDEYDEYPRRVLNDVVQQKLAEAWSSACSLIRKDGEDPDALLAAAADRVDAWRSRDDDE